eukprot:1788395-Pleurochrysis_carterae.AAC.1
MQIHQRLYHYRKSAFHASSDLDEQEVSLAFRMNVSPLRLLPCTILLMRFRVCHLNADSPVDIAKKL